MRMTLVLAAVAAALSIALEIVWHVAAHASLPWHAMPAFDLVYGVAGCIAIVEVSKRLGKRWLQRREDYWEPRP